jgi:hypothetical protein
MTTDTPPELLTFFKALSDETRLKIVGLLAQESYSGEQLAAILNKKPATVSHHISKLAEAGLVSTEAIGHSKLFRLRLDAVHEMAARLVEKDTLPREANADDVDMDAFDRKVIRDFSRRDGSFKELPAQYKKFLAILRHVVKTFEMEKRYTEKQVNQILSRFHEDTASLRRGLVDEKLMTRAEGQYWRL